MNKLLVVGLLGVFFLLIVSFLALRIDRINTNSGSQKILVAGSFYPLAHFSTQVGGDLLEVINMTPAGGEPHDFEPTVRDLALLRRAKLFIYNGAGLDAWAQKIAPDLEKSGVKVLEMSSVVPLISSILSQEEDEEGARSGEDGAISNSVISNDALSNDPHFWLDPVIAQSMVNAIADGLGKVDEANKDTYAANASRYLDSLAALDVKYQKSLANCQQREVIVSHGAFAYLAKRYNVNTHSISGLAPDEEPSVRQLGELATLAKEKSIKYVLFESLVSPKLAQTLAAEIGAKTLVFDPIEGLTADKIQSGTTYISAMEENLASLTTAMACR